MDPQRSRLRGADRAQPVCDVSDPLHRYGPRGAARRTPRGVPSRLPPPPSPTGRFALKRGERENGRSKSSLCPPNTLTKGGYKAATTATMYGPATLRPTPYTLRASLRPTAPARVRPNIGARLGLPRLVARPRPCRRGKRTCGKADASVPGARAARKAARGGARRERRGMRSRAGPWALEERGPGCTPRGAADVARPLRSAAPSSPSSPSSPPPPLPASVVRHPPPSRLPRLFP